ncbi:MAG: SpoIIE family protein phosphatase [Psychrilyobacter sp.]|nr:SpoIIE family protein phosphatase [Psychrilyobacter sp.]
MEYILIALLVGILTVLLLKKIERKNIYDMHMLIEKIGKREEHPDLNDELRESYNETVKAIKFQDAQLNNSVNELQEFKEELNITYDTLLKKSAQLEYSNEGLEREVANLSNINAVARTVLSTLELDKIIGVILDAYFVLTGVKKIAVYLWNDGELELKKAKGKFINNVNLQNFKDDSEKYKRDTYKKIYLQISETIEKVNTEKIIITELVVKGKELGVIYIIEDKDKITTSDQGTISALALQVAIAINNALIYSELIIKERLDRELEVAANIQLQLLPQSLGDIQGVEVAQYFKPAKEIGGDYYDYSISDENKLWVTIADVSGKGVPAAFLMGLIRSVIKTLEFKDSYPLDVLTDLNDIIYPDISEDMFVTIFHSQYDFLTKTLYYSNAGHNPLILYKAKTGEVLEENVKGVAIGFLENYEYRMGKIKLDPGDVLLYYTDGLNEAENESNELYGMDRLKNVIAETHDLDATIIKERILLSIDQFVKGKEQIDDITFVVVKIKN